MKSYENMMKLLIDYDFSFFKTVISMHLNKSWMFALNRLKDTIYINGGGETG